MAKIDFDFVDFGETVSDGSYWWRNGDAILPCSGRELNFKIAAITLVLRGIYPSGRQILKQLDSHRIDRGRKVNLNGQECSWKDDVFQLFRIKPYFGYAKRIYQDDWEETLSKMEFKYERGPKGTLRKIKSN